MQIDLNQSPLFEKLFYETLDPCLKDQCVPKSIKKAEPSCPSGPRGNAKLSLGFDEQIENNKNDDTNNDSNNDKHNDSNNTQWDGWDNSIIYGIKTLPASTTAIALNTTTTI